MAELVDAKRQSDISSQNVWWVYRAGSNPALGILPRQTKGELIMEDRQRPRLSIEITEEQNRKLMNLIPWGAKNALFQAIVEDVISLLETHGTVVIAAVLSKRLKVSDFNSLSDTLPKKKGKKS